MIFKKNKKIKIDARNLVASTFGSNVFHLVRTVVVANLLGPYLTGLFGSISTYLQVVGYATLGTCESLSIYIPFYRGKKQRQKLTAFTESVFTFNLAIVCLLFLILNGVTFFSTTTFNIKLSIFLCSVLSVLTQLYTFYAAYLNGERLFTEMIAVDFCLSLLMAVFNIVGVYFLFRDGYWYGLILAYIVTVAICFYLVYKREGFPRLRLNWTLLRPHIPTGILLACSKSIYLLYVSGIKLFLLFFSGSTAVGYFMPSVIILSRLTIIPKSIGSMSLPRISMLNSKDQKDVIVYKLFVKTQAYSLFWTIPLVVGGLVFMPYIFLWFLPQFESGKSIAMLVLLAGIPFCLIENANNVLLSLQKKRVFINLLVFSLVCLSVLLLIFQYRLPPLIATGVSLFLTFLLYAGMLNFFVLKILMSRKRIN